MLSVTDTKQVFRGARAAFHTLLVSSPDPAPKREKGLVYIERFLGRTGNSMSCDCHDNALVRHGNTSTALMHSNSWL